MERGAGAQYAGGGGLSQQVLGLGPQPARATLQIPEKAAWVGELGRGQLHGDDVLRGVVNHGVSASVAGMGCLRTHLHVSVSTWISLEGGCTRPFSEQQPSCVSVFLPSPHSQLPQGSRGGGEVSQAPPPFHPPGPRDDPPPPQWDSRPAWCWESE